MNAFAAVLQAATVLEDFLERYASPLGSANGAFAPGCINQLVTVAGILLDLLDAARTRALQGNNVSFTWEEVLVLEISKGERLGFVDETLDVDEEFVGVDLGNAAVIADKEIFVVGKLGLD